MKVLAENKNLIKDIRFEYPELMNDNAKESIKEEYYHIPNLKLVFHNDYLLIPYS